MHSLKLGGLEFNPSHTVNEHRPKNFTLPDIIIEEPDNSTFELTSIKADNNQSAPLTINDKDLAVTEHSVNPSSSDAQILLDNMWNEDLWLDVDFKEMHDPKHRHPRHHGK